MLLSGNFRFNFNLSVAANLCSLRPSKPCDVSKWTVPPKCIAFDRFVREALPTILLSIPPCCQPGVLEDRQKPTAYLHSWINSRAPGARCNPRRQRTTTHLLQLLPEAHRLFATIPLTNYGSGGHDCKRFLLLVRFAPLGLAAGNQRSRG